ncbi:uncharacterized protein FOMMEDRAFT_23938 [Fomitiporia mediterranea MF3/22]|uniref:uncharacterized protein n=1 Tax=Fomitiporia mediterranea (strain MF3/22) TaxID=694068 RepID=UPI00044087F6|nr:uncharacterized protein FOMMEDRAFT_23938 [Fomitiporia mediterranea MF3/22]EJC97870.1 hypothetical protein FOMMEDRAFT_23938 [Fomitiporia mediterranea MF3/22]
MLKVSLGQIGQTFRQFASYTRGDRPASSHWVPIHLVAGTICTVSPTGFSLVHALYSRAIYISS